MVDTKYIPIRWRGHEPKSGFENVATELIAVDVDYSRAGGLFDA
jgi:hypothetical protein